MQKIPFLMRFKQEIPLADPDLIEEESVYNDELMMNITSTGDLLWHMAQPSTSYWTAGKYVPSHRTASGKYVPGKSKPSKTDKRAGK